MTDSREVQVSLYQWLISHADDSLILSHRLSEWCGHAPTLEEDIALANIASDYLGQAIAWYEYASTLSPKKTSADMLAFFRRERHFYNVCLVELPKKDFSFTILRLFLFSTYRKFYSEDLIDSKDEKISHLSQRSYREACYHYRHSHYWLLCLGLGTNESHRRMQNSLDSMWQYIYELFDCNPAEKSLVHSGRIIFSNSIKKRWFNCVADEFRKANLVLPESHPDIGVNGRRGFHTEYLGHLLAEMQSLPRSMPEAKWD